MELTTLIAIISTTIAISAVIYIWKKSKKVIIDSTFNNTYLDQIPAGIILSSNDKIILYCNPYLSVLLGDTLDENTLPNLDVFKTYVDDSQQNDFDKAIALSLIGEETIVRLKLNHALGIDIWVDIKVIPLFDNTTTITGIILCMIDVSDLMHKHENLESKNQDLKDFSYMISHDFKAPLQTIKGMAHRLEKTTPANSNEITHIHQATKTLEDLAHSIIAYTSIEWTEMPHEILAMNDIIEHVISDLAQQLQSSNASCIIKTELPNIKGNRIQLYQVFLNIIENALKYKHPDRSPKIEISCREHTGRYAIIDIVDNGIGIDNETQQNIFRPFHRGKNLTASGTGIGLASVQKMLEKHNASISIKSEVNKGSCFTIHFPKL